MPIPEISDSETMKLITFSGSVGSGKSTCAKRVHSELCSEQQPSNYLRFRSLKWNKILRNDKRFRPKSSTPKPKPAGIKKPQRTGNIQTLSSVKFLGYLWRTANFRLFLRFGLGENIGVCDRYFYDNLVHYQFKTAKERLYLKVLKKAIPKPDLAFLMMAEWETISERRSNYDPVYLRALIDRYEEVAGEFPNLVVLKTDNPDELNSELAAALKSRIFATDTQSITTDATSNSAS